MPIEGPRMLLGGLGFRVWGVRFPVPVLAPKPQNAVGFGPIILMFEVIWATSSDLANLTLNGVYTGSSTKMALNWELTLSPGIPKSVFKGTAFFVERRLRLGPVVILSFTSEGSGLRAEGWVVGFRVPLK